MIIASVIIVALTLFDDIINDILSFNTYHLKYDVKNLL
jgi:hypothetical protein